MEGVEAECHFELRSKILVSIYIYTIYILYIYFNFIKGTLIYNKGTANYILSLVRRKGTEGTERNGLFNLF